MASALALTSPTSSKAISPAWPEPSDPLSNAWAELNSLSRAEVSQATGMLVAQLDVEPAEALVRLRAHAYATGRTSTEVARDILDRRLRLEAN